jgi:polyhydroxyalkanoate synthesis regulator phasin
MPRTNDLTARAQAAIEKIADRLPELPKPVLAALGAADLAGRQLSELVGRLGDRAGVKEPTVPDRSEVVDELRSTAADLPAKVQQLAADLPERVQEMIADLPARAKELADQLEEFATRLPGRVQKFTDELPGRVSEVGEQLQPDQIKQSAEAYGQLLSSVFATLAERGEKTWGEIRNSGPVPGSVVDADAGHPAPRSAAKSRPAGSPTVAERPSTAQSTPRPARRKPAAAGKPAAGKPTDGKPATGKPAAGKTTGKAADADNAKPASPAGAVRPTAVTGQPPTRPQRGPRRPS